MTRTLAAIVLCLVACGGGGEAVDASPPDDAEPVPLTVLATTPSDGATAAPLTSLVAVTFSRVMDPDAITVALAPAVALTATEWNAAGDALTLFPAAPLAPATTYTLTVGGAARDGSPLTGPTAFRFTTGDGSGDTTPPEITAFLPADEAACDSDVAIAFSEPMDPRTLTVTARPGHGLGAPTWAAGLRRVTFADTPAWTMARQVDVEVAASDLAGNPVTAQLRFTTCPLPVVAPAVVDTYPSPGATGVVPGTHFHITFSEPMDQSATRFAVTTSPPLACVRYVPPKYFAYFDDNSRTFRCYAGAAANTTYTVTVRAASDVTAPARATSEAGVLLPATYSFSFTTGPDPLDGAAPRLVALSPPDASRDAPVGTALVIGFDEEMDPTSGTLTIATPSFIDSSWTTPPTQVTYRFASDFPTGADVGYTLTDFRDRAGNTMPPVSASFSTAGRTVAVATSDPARDGFVESPGSARGDGDAIYVGITGPAAAPRNARGFVTFALPPALLAATGVDVHRAYLILDQSRASAAPLTGHNPMHVASVGLGDTLDAADYDGEPLLGNVDALDPFDGTTVRLHAVDVTTAVQYDLADRAERGGRSSFRLAFEHEADGTLGAGVVGISAGESATPPQLWIDYTHAR